MAEYIEREALLKEIKEWVEEVVSPSLFGKLEDLLAMDDKLLKAYWPISASVLPNTFLMHVTPDELADVVESVPAADVMEVVHGGWERFEDGRFVCSNCKQVKVSPDMLSFLLPTERWNYCPNCGAKMDGE